jgi:hypothetical protein
LYIGSFWSPGFHLGVSVSVWEILYVAVEVLWSESFQENLAHDFFLREISIEEFRDVGRGTRGG